MPELTMTLRTVTPMFLAGADQQKVELRTQSLRGALRFWWRALVGATAAYSKWDELRRREAAIFGASYPIGDADERTAGASPVIVRLRPTGTPEVRTFGRSRDWPGIGYLWWSMDPHGADAKPRACLQGEFQLTLATRPGGPRGEPASEEALRHVVGALWLLTRLGALGSRARRGAGAVQVEPGTMHGALHGLPPLPVTARTIKGFAQDLEDGLETWRRELDLPLAPHVRDSTFDVLHPDCAWVRLYSGAEWPNWAVALDQMGSAFQSFRDGRPGPGKAPDHPSRLDYAAMRRYITRPDDQDIVPALVRRAAFGLPLPFYSGSHFRRLMAEEDIDKETAGRLARATVEPDSSQPSLDRRASPLWIRPVLLANDDCAVALTCFGSQFLPNGVHLKVSGHRIEEGDVEARVNPGITAPPAATTTKIVRELLGSLPPHFAEHEVVLR